MATGTTNRVRGNGRSEAQSNGSGHKQRPVWTKKGFPLEVAVFEFTNEDGPSNFSVKLTRSFRRDEESEWESSDYLGGSDLLRASQLLLAADAFIQERLDAEYRSRRA